MTLRELNVEEIQVEEALPQTLYSQDGKLLLRKGRLFGASHLKSLRAQGYSSVYVHEEDEAEEQDAAEAQSPRDGNAPASFYQGSQQAGQSPRCLPYRPDVAVRVERLLETTAEMVAQLASLIIDHQLTDASPFQTASENLLDEIRGDQDQTLHQTLTSDDDWQLAHRSTQLSVLSMSIARQMSLADDRVAQVGTAALLCDIALFGLPETQRVPSANMTSDAERIFLHHPALTESLLESVRSVDLTVRAIVLQSHEQCDGSGFPRGLNGRHLNPLARIVNVADAYLTLVDPGLGRPGIIPADAIPYLIHHACAGRFDASVMRGLLRTLSLYPIGSQVRLSDDSTAKILRAQGDDPRRPVILRSNEETPIVDLAESSLVIDEPLYAGSPKQRRLLARKIDTIMWGLHGG